MQLARDVVLLLVRVGVGIILVAHGWQKLVTDGMDATSQGFEQMGVPLPQVSAYYSMIVELFGGAALILGLTVPVVAVLVLVDMAGAFVLVHVQNGPFVADNGFELVLAIGLSALTLLAFGAGRFGLDRLFGRRSKADEDEEAEEPVATE